MTAFDLDCTACPRLAGFLATTRQVYPDYFCRPVPAFGDPQPHLLIVGLAPGLHGANRTGRPFTGDYAGVLLYQTLHEFGYADRPESLAADDGLRLTGCRITNAVKCVPPGNKPEPAEIGRCNAYLRTELAALPAGVPILALGQVAHSAILKALGLKVRAHPFGHGAAHLLPDGDLALGQVAHSAILKALGLKVRAYPFGHGAAHLLPDGRRLYDSYHCSRYNTQTRRLTPEMFKAVFENIRKDMEPFLCP